MKHLPVLATLVLVAACADQPPPVDRCPGGEAITSSSGEACLFEVESPIIENGFLCPEHLPYMFSFRSFAGQVFVACTSNKSLALDEILEAQDAPEECAGGCEIICAVNPEVCNGEDDDCDGKVDEEFPIHDDCEGGVGACREPGKFICDPFGDGVICKTPGNNNPRPEDCDGVDDDCDGEVDEGGVCECDPAPETCNGADDDCDGEIDEDFPDLGEPCIDGVGECAVEGTIVCFGDGTVCAASGHGTPSDEVCNGLDDDCDFTIDEGIDCDCVPETEVCNGADDDCDGAVDEGGVCCDPIPEMCNGADDDCDGSVDEGDVCCVPEGETCDGTDEDCDGAIDEGDVCCTPTDETCDGTDEDCDGAIDEGDVCEPCDECDGGVIEIDLRNDGDAAVNVRVIGENVRFSGPVAPGETITVVGARDGNRFRNDVIIEVDGVPYEQHMSCSRPIAPGFYYGVLTLTRVVSRGGLVCPEGDICNPNTDPDCPIPCDECDGGVVRIDLRNDGAQPAALRVVGEDLRFEGMVAPGETVTVVGSRDENRFRNDVIIEVNGVPYEQHMSCSQPIAPGFFYGTMTLTRVASRGGEVCPEGDICNPNVDPDCPIPCDECDGGVVRIDLRNDGAAPTNLRVVGENVRFSGVVAPGETVTVVGSRDQNRFRNDVIIEVDGVPHEQHMSCSQPIAPGFFYGTMTLTRVVSRGGEVCPAGDICNPNVNPDCPEPCGECDGGVTQMRLRNGSAQAVAVRATDKDDRLLFAGNVAPGADFEVRGLRDDGKLGSETTFVIDGVEHALHTSCSQPIFPGMRLGALVVDRLYSRDGGLMCSAEDYGCTAEPGPLQFGSKEIKWRVNLAGPALLLDVRLGWPVGAPELEEVVVDGDKIFDDRLAPPLYLWSAMGANGALLDDGSIEFKFKFRRDIAPNPALFDIQLDFGGDCRINP